MPHRAPRILTLVLAMAGACLAASAAEAQSQAAPAAGRYLTWANRPVGTTPADVAAVQARDRTAMIPRRVAASLAPYRPMMQPTSTSLPASRGLTPASAWLGPRVVPAYAPGSPDPLAYATTEMAAPAPTWSPPPPPAPVAPAVADPMAPRRDAPVFNMQRQAPAPTIEAPMPQPAPQSGIDPNDPMAPRRDARIFQMQQSQTQGQGQEQAALPAPAESAPGQSSVQTGQSGARYYSVHRDAGHRPDPTALPEPVYFDSVTIDLAEPPVNEAQTRDAQGRRRVAPNADPSLP